MFSFVSVVRIEHDFAWWRALVLLADDGVPLSGWALETHAPITQQQASDAGIALAAQLNTAGARSELDTMVLLDVWRALRYQTKGQLADLFRTVYRAATKIECAQMATWLLNRIDDGTFTDLQVRNAFGLTDTEYTAMKARMTALRDNWLAVQAAQGE